VALLSTNRIGWKYTADNGTVYRVAAQKALTDQAKLGGSAADGTEPIRDTDWTLRRITLSDASGRSRVVVVYENGAPIVTAGESLNVNYLGDQHSLLSSGVLIPEHHKRPNVTKQTS
jgi:hypothetical protein